MKKKKTMTMKEIIKSYCDDSETKALLLLEHEEQVKNCLEWLKEIKGQKLIIALSPFAMHELDKHDVPYHILEDYYEPQELYQLGIDNYQKVEEICTIIDSEIQKACPIMEKLGIKPALFSFYYLNILYDAATIRLFQLSKLIEAEKPDVIFIYESEKYPFGISEMAPYLLFDNRESIYARILALDGWDVPVVMLPAIPQPENTYALRGNYQTILNILKKKAVGWLQTHPRLFDFAMVARKSGWHGLFSELKGYLPSTKHMPILLFGGGYNWDDCKEDLQSMGINPIIRMQDDLRYWMSGQFFEEVDSAILIAWRELCIDNKFRKFFIWDNVDFFAVVEERIRFLMEYLTLACLSAYEEATELLEKREIKAVLSSTISTCTGHSVSQAARNAHVPIISWQHGAYGAMNHPIVNHIDLMSSDIHFVFGEGVAERYAEAARRFGTQLIPIGSASLDYLYKNPNSVRGIKLYPEKKVVLYVISSGCQNNLYISPYPPFSDNHYWRTQQAILDVLGKHKDYTIIIKTHPSHVYRETPLLSYASEKGFENCQFIRDECSFTDLLPLADIIVIDIPSTTLLQALTTTKPLFAVLKDSKIDDDALNLLKRRAYCYFDLKEFTNDLDTFLSSGSIDTDVDLNDREFLKTYGTHLDDDKSGVRAANMLINIINNSKLDKHASKK